MTDVKPGVKAFFADDVTTGGDANSGMTLRVGNPVLGWVNSKGLEAEGAVLRGMRMRLSDLLET